MGPEEARLGDICSDELVTVEPGTSVDDALRIMREHAPAPAARV